MSETKFPTDDEIREQIRIRDYNERIWESEQMHDAQERIAEALGELRTGKGWGHIPLQSANDKLLSAMNLIDQMLAWPVPSPTGTPEVQP